MVGSSLITKEKFKAFLEKTFINKDLTMDLLTCFYKNTYKANLDMVMFLLYNEYFPVDMISRAVYIMGANNENNQEYTLDVGGFEKELLNIIDYAGRLLGTPYGTYTDKNGDEKVKYEKNIYSHIKYDFFRNYVTTLTFKYYESVENYTEQMKVIYSALTPLEKDFLNDCLYINDENFQFLIRKQKDDYTIDLAEVEKYDDTFEKDYGDDIDFKNSQITNRNLKFYVVKKDGYYKINNNNIEETTRTDKNSKKYLLSSYTVVYPEDATDINATSCTIYGKPSIISLSAILNLTDTTNDDYWYYNNDDKYSKRDLLKTILNKISLGTIHY